MQHRRHAALLITLVGIALFVVVAPRYPARAAIGSGCRTDPIFMFSNGDNLSLTMIIGVLPHDVIRIEYALRAPAGAALERVVTTGPVESDGPTTLATADYSVFLPAVVSPKQAASPRYVESWTVVSDQPPGTYIASAKVTTVQNRTPVTFQLRLAEYKQSVAGVSEQWLTLEVRP